MSTATQFYSEQTTPTTTFSSLSATSATYSDQTSSTATFTELQPTLEGKLFGAGDYDTEFYQTRAFILGRAE